MERRNRWYLDHRLWLEAFALVNLAFLSLDIYLAHSVNHFRLLPSTCRSSSRWPRRRFCLVALSAW